MIGAVGRVGLLGLQSGRHGRLLLYPGYVQILLDRVTAADVGAGNTQGLEVGVTDAISTCVQTLVADGILGVSGGALSQAASLIKASCAMQGARTLSGALVPLAADMPAPTNFNFVAGDYIRRTGLGDPANVSKHLNTNRAANADLRENKHIAVFMTTHHTRDIVQAVMGDPTGNLDSQLLTSANQRFFRVSVDNVDAVISDTKSVAGFWGASKNALGSITGRYDNVNTVFSSTPTGNSTNELTYVFSRNANYSNARINFYSIGSALDLAILDARISALSNAIQAAIAP